jgi:hypothetical protein
MGRMSPRGHAICPRAPNVIAATRVEKVFYVPAGTRLWGFIEGLVRPIIGSAIIRPIGWVSTHVMFACRSYFEPSIQQSATSRAELSFAFLSPFI